MVRARKRYISKLTKEEQMVRLILRIMSRDEKRRKRELNLTDDILLIDLATRIQLGCLIDFPEDDSDEEDARASLKTKPRQSRKNP
jgi:hypothetical protein